jgi:hypothetical protein
MRLLTAQELNDAQLYKEPANSGIGYEKNIAIMQLKKAITELEKVGEVFLDGESEAICIPIEHWNKIKKEI